MLKKISIRKIMLSSLALFAMLLIYIIPENNSLNIQKQLEYVNYNVDSSPIFLLDKNSYIALTSTALNDTNVVDKARQLIKVLTIGGMESKLPSGFSAIIPPNTEILSLSYEKGLIKIDFSKDLLDIKKESEEKMIEAIVYTLTSIESVEKIIIYVEGDILTKLPKSKINLPSTLDKSFGINKEFNLTNTKNIQDVTIYYINEVSDNYYYVPVTKYINDTNKKIDIIINELSNNVNNNLMSFLDENTKLVSSTIKDNNMYLDFNENIVSDLKNNISKEILDTISLSVHANYDINNVIFNVNGKKIYEVQ